MRGEGFWRSCWVAIAGFSLGLLNDFVRGCFFFFNVFFYFTCSRLQRSRSVWREDEVWEVGGRPCF